MGNKTSINILNESPFDSPNSIHVARLHNREFLKLLKHEVLARLVNGMNEYLYSENRYCKSLEDCAGNINKSVRLIGGFLTKFARDDSDIDVNVVVKNKILKSIDKDIKEAEKKIHDWFRDNVNGKPLSDEYDYTVNFFFKSRGLTFVPEHGVQLLGDEIKHKDIQDELDKKMVDVTQYLSEEKFNQYFFKPMKKAIKIIRRMIDDRKLNRIDDLTGTYSIKDRIGSEVFYEFRSFDDTLKTFNYSSDNLRYKAMNEGSDFYKFMVYANSSDQTKLKKWLALRKWRLNLKFEESISPQILSKVIER